MSLKSVKVPDGFSPIFEKAETYVKNYFDTFKQDSSKGTIEINGERYILVRSASMSVHFLQFIKNMYPAISEEEAIVASSRVLHDLAKAIGSSDAKNFHHQTHMSDPIEKLSTGPVHFAYTGWAFVDIAEQSNPSPDENFCLLYDHPQSFEADSWIEENGKTDFCVCFMNAGYSSGWCEQSFGISLTAQEISCRARGEEHCRFVMAQPHRLQEFVEKFSK